MMMPNELKEWRAKHGYSQAGLARVLGVFHLTISKWERGDRKIPPFLHLALETIAMKGGDTGVKQHNKETKKKKKGE